MHFQRKSPDLLEVIYKNQATCSSYFPHFVIWLVTNLLPIPKLIMSLRHRRRGGRYSQLPMENTQRGPAVLPGSLSPSFPLIVQCNRCITLLPVPNFHTRPFLTVGLVPKEALANSQLVSFIGSAKFPLRLRRRKSSSFGFRSKPFPPPTPPPHVEALLLLPFTLWPLRHLWEGPRQVSRDHPVPDTQSAPHPPGLLRQQEGDYNL